MAKIFLDANIFIDIVEKRRKIDKTQFLNHNLFITPLSIHLLTYLYKYKIPAKALKGINQRFSFVPFDGNLTLKALTGPTLDFEDNVQLHSAAEAECDLFLTEDRKLLNLKFFGKTRIVNTLAQS